jgi:predicted metalloprotease
MNSRITATLTLVSALVVLGFGGAVTTTAQAPRADVTDSLRASSPGSLASPGGGQNSIALLSGGAETTQAKHPPSDATPANIQGSAGTMKDFLDFVITDVDAYWSGVWEDAGRPEPQVTYAFPAAGEVLPSQCGGPTDDLSAFYCPPDDEIIVSQSVAVQIWDGTIVTNPDGNMQHKTGDFSVAYVVAHEYAHSLQAELGILRPNVLVYPTVNTELHADCWAGVWANSADYEGILDRGDIEEAVQTTLDLGDYAIDDPLHHGTPAQRSEAFLTGYDSGIPDDCEPYLLDHY